MASKCKIVTNAAGRRRVCWGANGKIKSNTAVRGASGVGSTRKKAKSKTSSAKTFVAKASYYRNADGSMRKGCTKNKKTGTVRCKKPGLGSASRTVKPTRRRRRRR